MPYEWEKGERIDEGIRRVVREEIAHVVASLQPDTPETDANVHEARKSIKKIRAVLRLVRVELKDRYDIENRRLRDAGRKLSGFRDAEVLIETFDRLFEKEHEESKEISAQFMREALVRRHRDLVAREKGNFAQAVKEATAMLEEAGQDAQNWPIEDRGFETIAKGLKKVYRQGRKAYKRTRLDPIPRRYHELRKHVKYCWYHHRLQQGIAGGTLDEAVSQLDTLGELLGVDHDMTVLHETLENRSLRLGTQEEIQALARRIEAQQAELKIQAHDMASTLYTEKPKAFQERMRKIWEEAHSP